jgi:hypothetical protein
VAGEIPCVSREQILEKAQQLRNAAVKLKGEMELRYVPRDTGTYRGVAGKRVDADPGEPFAIGEDGKYLGTEADWAALDSQYSWIIDFYDHHIGPEPSDMDGLVETLRSVSSRLYFAPTARPGDTPMEEIEPVRSWTESARDNLTDWMGHAAEAFQVNFLKKLPQAAQAQAYLAAALAHAVQGNRDMFLALRADLLDNATKAITAVEQSHHCDPKTVKTVITVVGAVATVAAGAAAIPVTGGAVAPGAAAGLDIIAGISSGIAAADLGEKKETRLDAHTVDGVLSNVVDAVIGLAAEVTIKEEQMVKALERTYDVITGAHTSELYLVPKPGVVTMTDAAIKAETGFRGLPGA